MHKKTVVIGLSAAMLLLSMAGCTPPIAETEDTVRVRYVGELTDGTVFDSSHEEDPLEFTIGVGHVIAAFENPIIGMKPGESKTFTVPPEEAYGPHREELVFDLLPEDFPQEMDVYPGALVTFTGGGATIRGLVTEVTDTKVVVDANRPLAGETLVFHVELVEVLRKG